MTATSTKKKAPNDNRQLRITMYQADSDIRNRLLAARLPAMPQILLKLIEQCQASKVGMAALAELISKDPGMTAKLLGVANSPT